jgi:hypothetical protein
MKTDEIILKLQLNTVEVLTFVKGIPSADFNKQTLGKWNILQILEHVYITEKLVGRLLSQPSSHTSKTPEILGDDKLKRAVVDLRNRKVQAPELFHPKGKFKTIEDFEKLFSENRTELIAALGSGKIVVDGRIQKHPYLGEMTITDWLYFMPHHTQRHLEQIKDIIAAD